MKKLLILTIGVVALATAGLAVARGLDESKSAKLVSGSFAAATVANSQTRTCTTTEGKSISTTKATYTGAATGDADLTGPITLDARSIVNTTDNVGVVEGKLKIAATGGDTVAHFVGVYDHGNLAGVAEGHALAPHARLLANLSSGFSADGGFTAGKIGGSSGGSAVELGPGKCAEDRAVKETSEAIGTVTAISSTSITVAGLTCSLSGDIAAKVNDALKLNDRASIRCSLSAGSNSLVSFRKR